MLLIVIEPGNIDKLQVGEPVKVSVGDYFDGVNIDVFIAYTPDMLWVKKEYERGRPLNKVLEESLLRKEVHSRPYHPKERI